MRKKILFIIPYIPYPLDSGGNQAFFNMVEYLRHKMAVSVLLYPETGRRMQDVESLKKIWDNVDFFIYTPKTKSDYPKLNILFIINGCKRYMRL